MTAEKDGHRQSSSNAGGVNVPLLELVAGYADYKAISDDRWEQGKAAGYRELGEMVSAALASLSTPTAEPISEPTRRMEQTLGAKFALTPDRIGKDAVREALANDNEWVCAGIPDEAVEAGIAAWRLADVEMLARDESDHPEDMTDWDEGMIVCAIFKAVGRALSATPPAQESKCWRPIETCPQEDLFIGAVQVRDNRSGAEWWERHLLALDDETGEIHADYEQGWALADYSWWLPFSTPPIPAALPSHQGAGE